MNKTISNLRSGLAAVVTVGLILGTASVTRAADGTKTLILTGAISTVADIEVAPESGYNALALSGPKTDVKVATVTEVCNSATGYTVSLASLNAVGSVANMVDATDGSHKFVYTMKYGTHSVALTEKVDADVTGGVILPTTQTGTVRFLTVSWLGQSLPAGTFSDTLTLTIAAKL